MSSSDEDVDFGADVERVRGSATQDYGPRMQLYCRTGWHLAIYPDGKVRGTKNDQDKHSLLELSFAGVAGHVKIQGVETGLYLAINPSGFLYAEADGSRSNCVWIESMMYQYNNYLSRHYAHLGWYMALKKSGKPKKGVKTVLGQKATQFLPRRGHF